MIRKPVLAVVPDAAPELDEAGPPAQTEMRLLAPARLPAQPEPSLPDAVPVLPPTVPLPLQGGVYYVPEDLSPAERRQAQLLLLEQQRDRERRRDDGQLRFDTDAERHAAGRATLRAFAARTAPAALVIAGRLYVEHGDRARRALHETWRPDCGAPLARIDDILARAGLPPGGTLL